MTAFSRFRLFSCFRRWAGEIIGAVIIAVYLFLSGYGLLNTFTNHGPVGGFILLAVSLITAFVPAAVAGLVYSLGNMF